MANFSPVIGKAFGIDVQLHWSFLLLLLFSLYISLASGSLYLFIIIVMLFICVFIHELAHSITAKRNGLKIKRIMLLPIGGVSEIEDADNMSPKLEFRVAIVGPLMSIFLGLVFGILAAATPAGMLRQLFQFMFLLNILLGVFNILPGFPLDGGRVLRGYLRRKKSFIDATKTTAKVGNAFIALFIVFTFAYVAIEPYSLFYKEFIVLWDFIIAVYLYGGAKEELQSAYIREYAMDLKVKDALSRDYIMVKPNATLLHIYELMIKKKKHIIITKKGKEIKAVARLSFNILNDKRYRNAEDASVPMPSVKANDSLSKALREMGNSREGIAAVFSGNKFLGILLARHAESIIALHLANKLGIKEHGRGI
ncbi:MAG: site-2 protease family protein [Candidatus Micrarchaeaceae archaeon]